MLFVTSEYAPAQCWYSYYLSVIEKNFEEAINHTKIAYKKLEPLAPISHHILSVMYKNAGKYEKALQASKVAIELDGSSFPV